MWFFNANEKVREDNRVGIVGTELEDFFSAAHVQDLRGFGCEYTWTNSHVSCKLNRAVANEKWLQSWTTNATFHNAGISDHSPILVTVGSGDRKRKGVFRYKKIWGSDCSFSQLVQEAWAREVFGCAMYKLVVKLREMKKLL